LIFKCNGIFLEAKRKLVNQAQKGLYSLYTNIRNQAIPTDLQLKHFDAMVEPILLYGCEIWGVRRFLQNEAILILILISKGNLPNSPYTI
jgi:hypothetical protein